MRPAILVQLVLGLAGALLTSTSTVAREAPLGVSSDWVSAAREAITRIEYEFNPSEPGSYSAPNRIQNLRTTITGAGLHLTTREPSDEPWKLTLRLSGVGRGDDLADPGPGQVGVEADRVELARGLLTEWFVNRPSGLEHGFTIPERPGSGGDGPLVLEMVVEGNVALVPDLDARGVTFTRPSGRVAMRYDKLAVFDATGAEIASRFERAEGRLRIVVEDESAAYPVLVDPLATTPNWEGSPGQAYALFGQSVASAGDVNGDGFDDVIGGADEYDIGQISEGAAFVFYGSATGLQATPDWIAESNQALADFGISVSGAGDVNDDGFDDIIVGAHRYNTLQTCGLPECDEGAAFVYYGSATGLDNNGLRPNGNPNNADWRAESTQQDSNFGRTVARAGDVNADGYDDVVVGADEYSNGQAFEGITTVYHGSPTGLDANGTRPVGDKDNADWFGEGNLTDSDYGFAGGTAGDVNGDGFDDIIVGAWNFDQDQEDEGRIFLYYGSAAGVEALPAWTYDSNENFSRSGVAVAGAGDVNGDGFDDIIVGADEMDDDGQQGVCTDGSSCNNNSNCSHLFDPTCTRDQGKAFIFFGSAGGLGATPDWEVFGQQTEMDFGRAVASAGDINADGYGDVIVGAEGWDTSRFCEDATTPCLFDEDCLGIGSGACQIDHGAAYVFLGSSSGPGTTPDWEYTQAQALAAFGISVASAGDVNGDGFGDIVIGAEAYDNLEIDEGRVFLFFGCFDTARPAEVPTNAVWTSNTTIAWTAASGAESYDVISSSEADDFVTAGTCVATTTNTNAQDNSGQSSGQLDFYLVRAWGNSCPGPLGVDSNDNDRQALPSCN